MTVPDEQPRVAPPYGAVDVSSLVHAAVPTDGPEGVPREKGRSPPPPDAAPPALMMRAHQGGDCGGRRVTAATAPAPTHTRRAYALQLDRGAHAAIGRPPQVRRRPDVPYAHDAVGPARAELPGALHRGALVAAAGAGGVGDGVEARPAVQAALEIVLGGAQRG